MEFKKERKVVAYFMKRLYRQGLTTTSGGNVSLKVNDKIFITPSQIDKGEVKTKEIAILNLDGENLTPELKSSMETEMHLEIYKSRKDISAIVHAHPVVATAFTASEKKIKTNLMGESWAVIGEPVKAKYELMGTLQLAKAVASSLSNANVALLENHGILAVGTSLLQAFDRLEVLEASAKVTLITELLGDCHGLSGNQQKEIEKLFE